MGRVRARHVHAVDAKDMHAHPARASTDVVRLEPPVCKDVGWVVNTRYTFGLEQPDPDYKGLFVSGGWSTAVSSMRARPNQVLTKVDSRCLGIHDTG